MTHCIQIISPPVDHFPETELEANIYRLPIRKAAIKFPRILALDIATNTGWALDDGRHIRSGSIWFAEKLRAKDRKRPKILSEARSMLNDLVNATQPDQIVYESPFMRGAGSRLLWGLTSTVECIASERGIPVSEMAVKSVRKKLIGTGSATKDDVQIILRSLGYAFSDDDEADAIALLLAFRAGFR